MIDFAHLTEPDGTVYPHLLADALTALILMYAMDVDHAVAVKALQDFKPGGHRIEEVARLTTDGATVRFVDDSKATNALAEQVERIVEQNADIIARLSVKTMEPA